LADFRLGCRRWGPRCQARRVSPSLDSSQHSRSSRRSSSKRTQFATTSCHDIQPAPVSKRGFLNHGSCVESDCISPLSQDSAGSTPAVRAPETRSSNPRLTINNRSNGNVR
jgi:hypothetical protein